ncbi:AAA family ATPase [Bradyrhizobium barranii]|uniref:AAA family ATPase n=1 Tax=Bradyrhizobium TaxID=374 RepID=UPI0024AED310|nr:AAA family ATPase [Bradyrhizobium barranii]WFT91935.1 AAA family ATPase [Bradyrhizobium barranii]
MQTAAKTSTDPTEAIVHLRRGLIAQGYRVVPCSGKKACGLGWSNSKWSAEQMEGLARLYPHGHNTGVLTGSVVAIDVDTPDQATSDAILAMVAKLPGLAAAPYRIGKAPKRCYVFRSDSPRGKVATGAYLIDGQKCQVEVLGAGQQFVAYGTHPETGRNYEWFNGSPAETPFVELPEIHADDIDAMLASAEAYLSEHGTLIKHGSKAPANDNEKPVHAWSDHPWSALNQRAYDYLDAWVPQLGLEELKRYHAGYHAVASFRPSNSSTAKKRGRALNIQPEGICDYADNNRGYSPIDLVGVCRRLQSHEAVDWLRERVGEPDDGTHAVSPEALLKKRDAGNVGVDDDEDTRDAFPGIMSSGEFVRGFVPPDYLIDGIIQSGFLYSITGQTGAGKTAVALLMTSCIARGEPLSGQGVKRGRVLYFAGENPDDVRMRWIGLCHESGLNPDDVDVHFIEGVFSIPEFAERIEQDVIALGGVDTIFVDTTAAYFPGTDENSNVEMGAYARLLRSLTRMECRPAVIAASHPIKNASEGNLLPRGGGAFLNEVDGNLALAKKGERTSELHWQGKFRGPEFARITFDLPEIRVPTLVDSRGRQIPTVMARTVSDGELSARAAAAMKEDQEMLIAIRANGKRSLRDLAEFLKWGDDDAAKRKAQTVTDRLKKAQMIQYDLGVWSLTKKGEQAAPEAARVLHAENAARQSAANVVSSGRRKHTSAVPARGRYGTD